VSCVMFAAATVAIRTSRLTALNCGAADVRATRERGRSTVVSSTPARSMRRRASSVVEVFVTSATASAATATWKPWATRSRAFGGRTRRLDADEQHGRSRSSAQPQSTSGTPPQTEIDFAGRTSAAVRRPRVPSGQAPAGYLLRRQLPALRAGGPLRAGSGCREQLGRTGISGRTWSAHRRPDRRPVGVSRSGVRSSDRRARSVILYPPSNRTKDGTRRVTRLCGERRVQSGDALVQAAEFIIPSRWPPKGRG